MAAARRVQDTVSGRVCEKRRTCSGRSWLLLTHALAWPLLPPADAARPPLFTHAPHRRPSARRAARQNGWAAWQNGWAAWQNGWAAWEVVSCRLSVVRVFGIGGRVSGVGGRGFLAGRLGRAAASRDDNRARLDALKSACGYLFPEP
jgi:hypothetical protein